MKPPLLALLLSGLNLSGPAIAEPAPYQVQRPMEIQQKLQAAFSPVHLEVINESDNHNVPKGSESHFKVVLVAPEFDGLKLLERHRLVNETLAEQLAGGVHALAVHTYTEAEWAERFGDTPMSPPCHRRLAPSTGL